MTSPFIQCCWCDRDFYPNQLIYSEHHGGMTCQYCLADQGPTHGEIQAEKRERARAKAWNCGEGFNVPQKN
jgi:hypothetical protein